MKDKKMCLLYLQNKYLQKGPNQFNLENPEFWFSFFNESKRERKLRNHIIMLRNCVRLTVSVE